METKDRFVNFCIYMECIKSLLKEGFNRGKTDARVRRAIYKATKDNQYRLNGEGHVRYYGMQREMTVELFSRQLVSKIASPASPSSPLCTGSCYAGLLRNAYDKLGWGERRGKILFTLAEGNYFQKKKHHY